MGKLFEKIKSDSIVAMKDSNKQTLYSLRLLIAEIEKERIHHKQDELSDEHTQSVITRQVKKLDKEIESYESVGRDTYKQAVEKELLISYLPEQATEDEIRELAEKADSLVRNREIKNAMQYLSPKLKGKADMKLVAKIAKEVQRENDNTSA